MSLAIEIYKFQANSTPPMMNDPMATRENNYNLRNVKALQSSRKQTVKIGTETISYREPQIWNLIPDGLRILETLNKLKKKINKRKCGACPCKMCKAYIQHVGFLKKDCNVFFSQIPSFY